MRMGSVRKDPCPNSNPPAVNLSVVTTSTTCRSHGLEPKWLRPASSSPYTRHEDVGLAPSTSLIRETSFSENARCQISKPRILEILVFRFKLVDRPSRGQHFHHHTLGMKMLDSRRPVDEFDSRNHFSENARFRFPNREFLKC